MNKITSGDFQSAVLESDKPVVVDFSATWCGPCRMLEPVLKDLESNHSDSVNFVKVDIDESGDLASKYGVVNVPTLILFKGGEVSDRKVGLLPKPALETWIKENV